jgi:hypothetical protein
MLRVMLLGAVNSAVPAVMASFTNLEMSGRSRTLGRARVIGIAETRKAGCEVGGMKSDQRPVVSGGARRLKTYDTHEREGLVAA